MGSFEEASRRARLHRARVWIKNRSPHQKTALVVGLCVCLLLVLKLIVEDHDALFLMAEAVHCLGIGVLGPDRGFPVRAFVLQRDDGR
jgi:hypothetical protein